jgi:hypothetical protein
MVIGHSSNVAQESKFQSLYAKSVRAKKLAVFFSSNSQKGTFFLQKKNTSSAVLIWFGFSFPLASVK